MRLVRVGTVTPRMALTGLPGIGLLLVGRQCCGHSGAAIGSTWPPRFGAAEGELFERPSSCCCSASFEYATGKEPTDAVTTALRP